ncbi:MAG: hypothetical protein ACOY0T_16935 [Myxococcota bacterium]
MTVALCSLGCATTPSGITETGDCAARPVSIVRENEFVRGRYRVLQEVKVSCPPLNLKRCDRLLREQACPLAADVIVFESRTISGRRGPSQTTQKALLVQFATSRAAP